MCRPGSRRSDLRRRYYSHRLEEGNELTLVHGTGGVATRRRRWDSLRAGSAGEHFARFGQALSGHLAVVGVLLGASVAATLALAFAFHGAVDLEVYRAGVSVFVGGGDPYASGVGPHHLKFTYPPPALLALAPLDVLPLHVTEALWALVNIVALACSFWLVGCRGRRPWSSESAAAVAVIVAAECLLLEPVRSTLGYGQINAVLMALVLADLLLAKRFRGVATGIAAALKLSPALFLVLFLLQRDWRSAKRMCVTIAAAVGLTWVVSPRSSSDFWLHKAVHVTRIGSLRFAGNQSFVGALHRVDPGGRWATALWAVLSVVAVAAAWIVCRYCIDHGNVEVGAVVLAITSLLISPVSWSHHWIWVALVPALAIGGRFEALPMLHRMRSVPWILVAIALFAPYGWSLPGFAGQVADDVMVAIAFGLLLLWAMAIARSKRTGSVDAAG